MPEEGKIGMASGRGSVQMGVYSLDTPVSVGHNGLICIYYVALNNCIIGTVYLYNVGLI